MKSGERPRRERRKETVMEKKTRKHQSWLQHQKSLRADASHKSNPTNIKKPNSSLIQTSVEEEGSPSNSVIVEKKKLEAKSKALVCGDCIASKSGKEKRGSEGNLKKTKFEEFLEIDMQSSLLSAEEDMKLERKLAKKLKVKGGQLRGGDDGINMLFKGIPSMLDSSRDTEISLTEEIPVESSEKGILGKKRKKRKSSGKGLQGENNLNVAELDPVAMHDADLILEEPTNPSKKECKKKLSEQGPVSGMVDDGTIDTSKSVDFSTAEVEVEKVPVKTPTSEVKKKYVAPHLRSRGVNESEDYSQVRRLIRRILNKLSESNVESMTRDMSEIFRSVPRIVASQIISEEVLASCSGGPRGNEQYAAVFAAFVAGMACLVGIDFSAKLMASLAKLFEDEYLKEDNLSLRNLTLLLSYLCIFGVCSSDLIYDFMTVLSKRLTEMDVSTILTILQTCGMKIRGDDPSAMKNFILNVQTRVQDLKEPSGDGQSNKNGKRMEFMLGTICDIKNNKTRSNEDSVNRTRIKKWLQKLRVEDILIRELKWSKLLDPDKKGQWWLCGDVASTSEQFEEVASTIDKEVLEAQKMLQLAASQRMNTDARKAIFCIIMSGEDYIDAFEKLLRLDLSGKQDREILRVLVECCLQEKVFNKYYTVLASKLCEHEKNHKFTLQFCLWDQFNELESMQLIRSMNLAKFVAEMVASFTLSLSVLKKVELSDIKLLTPKTIMHFRILFESILEYPDKIIWNVFTRIAVDLELGTLRNGIEFFIREYVVKANKAVIGKFKIVKKALNNVEGVLM